MARSILVAVDLSDKGIALRVLAEALGLLTPGSTLHVVSVLPDFGIPQVSGFFAKDYEKQALAAFGKALGDWVNENVPAGVDVHPHVLHGTIYDEVLRAADKLEIDVIVLGAHRPALQDYLLGPNAARVVRHANCSVFVVRE